jgi:hypothetical protein
MNLSIRRVFNVTLKSLLAIIGLLVLVIVGLAVYMELKSRPLGSPPPGFEERLKYDLDDPPGPKSTTTVWPNLLSRYECSGQVFLATVFCALQYLCSTALGANPSL